MQATQGTSTTMVIEREGPTMPEERKEQSAPITIVKLKPKPKKKVVFTEDTIDNESMNRLKSNSTLPFILTS